MKHNKIANETFNNKIRSISAYGVTNNNKYDKNSK
jgi:hypothetical protein